MEGEESGKPKTESADTQEKDKQAAEQQKKRNAGIALIKPEYVVFHNFFKTVFLDKSQGYRDFSVVTSESF